MHGKVFFKSTNVAFVMHLLAHILASGFIPSDLEIREYAAACFGIKLEMLAAETITVANKKIFFPPSIFLP